MKILFLSRWFPYPPANGSKLRIYNLLRGLARDHSITLISFADRVVALDDISQLQALGLEVKVVPWKPFNPSSRKAMAGFLNPLPRWAIDTFSQEIVNCLEETLQGGDFEAVIASEVDMAMYGSYFRGLPALLEEAEVGVLYEQFTKAASPWKRFRYWMTWAKHRRYLARMLRYFRACTVVSEQERELLSQAVPGYQPISVVPNFINLEDYQAYHQAPHPGTLIFTGSFGYYPNYDAMHWFLQEVYPSLQEALPDIFLTITGSPAGRTLPGTAKNLKLTGHVEDIRPLIATSWVSLVPVRQGGGTRLKILEAMALKTPVVATSKGAEGLEVRHEEHLLIADSPQDYAQAVLRVLTEPGLRERLVENAYRLMQTKYDFAAVFPDFLEILGTIRR